MSRFAVILPAAGKSSRFKDQHYKKPFAPLDGKPVWLHAAERFIKKCWTFESLTKNVTDPNTSPKTRLSDWCGANQSAYAVYETLETSGPPHNPVFTVKASVEGHGEATAKGGNKAEAERAAARALLDLLEQS